MDSPFGSIVTILLDNYLGLLYSGLLGHLCNALSAARYVRRWYYMINAAEDGGWSDHESWSMVVISQGKVIRGLAVDGAAT